MFLAASDIWFGILVRALWPKILGGHQDYSSFENGFVGVCVEVRVGL